VVDADGNLLGMVTKSNLLAEWPIALLSGDGKERLEAIDAIIAYDLLAREPITAFSWESCRTAAERMAEFGVGRLVIVSPDDHASRSAS